MSRRRRWFEWLRPRVRLAGDSWRLALPHGHALPRPDPGPIGRVAKHWAAVVTAKAGDNVGATKHLAALVTGDSVENLDKLPPGLREGLLDNAPTLPLLFAAPPLTMTCDALRAIKVPTLVVRGERTPRFFTATNAAVSKCIAGSTTATIAKASHAMSFDNPAEFNRAVMEFIAQHAKP